MAEKKFTYVIIGGGLAGASAIEGIREIDGKGPILLISGETNMPYDRPPLSKKLWFGKKTIDEIFLHEPDFYGDNNVEMELGVSADAIDAKRKTVTTSNGKTISYSKLLIATGGTPRLLDVPGGSLPGISYYRTLEDYKRMRSLVSEKTRAVIIGGGFIGSELAAALTVNKAAVTMIFPENCLVERIFPADLGKAIQKQYVDRGISVLNGDVPVSFEKKGSTFLTATRSGRTIESDIVIAGIGIAPAQDLAHKAGLATDNGIVVDEYLVSSDPDIYSAGDNTSFISAVSGSRVRVEHWDNSLTQGRSAGRNMAGAKEKYNYIPYFFSDLFEFGYEAAGEIDSRLTTFADWKKEFDTGVIYYLKDDIVRGVMLCNVWGKVEAARDLIRKGTKSGPEQLRGAIPY